MAKADKLQVREPENKIGPVVEEPEWSKRLKEKAKETRSNLITGVPKIKHKGTFLTIEGEKVKDNKLRAVILGLVWSKQHYEKPYEEGSKDSPDCYAFGQKERGLVPHPGATKKQAESCDECPHNKFGTALKGKGKRCQDRPKLALILADDLQRMGDQPVERAVSKANLYQLEVPPSSIKILSKYIGTLGECTNSGDVSEAVTEIFATPREAGGHELSFTFLDKVPDAAMDAIVKKSEGIFERIAQAFPVLSEEKEQVQEAPVKGQEPVKKAVNQKGKR